MSVSRHVRDVGREDEAVTTAEDVDFVGRVWEGDVCFSGEEDDPSEGSDEGV